MYKAKDTRSGRIVSAGEASPHGSFLCPNCNKPVFLRRGDIRAAHFAHRFAAPECELYVHSEGIADPWTIYRGRPSDVDEPLVERIAPLALSIALEPEEQGGRRNRRQWKLCVTIPKSTSEHGRISFDSGGGVRRTVPLSTLAVSAHTHPVDPNAADYGAVWISPEVPPAYRDIVTHRLPGLERDLITAFATAPQKYRPRVATLSWSATYYFVWRQTLGLALPDELPRRDLAQLGEWKCALVSLPDEGEAQLAEWLARTTGLTIVPEKKRWSLLYPPAQDTDIAGRIQLAPSHTLYVGLSAESAGQDMSLECRIHGDATTTTIRDAARRFIEIDRESASAPVVIRLAWDGTSLPELVTTPWRSADTPFIRVDFQSPRATPSNFPLQSAGCRSALTNVRVSDLEISAFTLPAGLPGELRWRIAGEDDLHTRSLIAPRSAGLRDVRLAPGHVAEMNRLLKDRRSYVWIDFGAFGSYHAVADLSPRATAVGYMLRLDTRKRLVWFCKTSGASRGFRAQKFDKLSDAELVRHFSTAPSEPSLAVHRRAIEAEIRRQGAS